ncbi:MAG: autotransporter-associated beta strand repeat-containing protein [Planctomycetota bacterium]
MNDPRTPKMAWLGKMLGSSKSREKESGTRTPNLECLEDRLVLATLTWQGVSGNNWSVAANWVENAIPQDGDTLVFNSNTPPTSFQSINDIAGLDLVTIQIVNDGSSSFSISGEAITISTSITRSGSGSGTDNLGFNSVTLAAGVALTNNGTSILTLSAPIDTNGQVLTVSGTGNTNLTGAVTGTGGITKSGTSTLTLSGNNTYSGATTLSGGTIATQGSGIGDNSAVSIANGATLVLNANETIGSLAGVAGSIVDLNTFTLSAGGNNTSTTFAGVLSDSGALTKQGSGNMTLSGTNTYTGQTTVSAGTLTLQGGTAINNAGAVSVSSGATLTLSNNEEIGSLAGSSGSTVQLGGNQLTTGNDSSTSFGGVITGTGSVEKRGTGTFTISGNNNYSGGTTVTAGVLAGTTLGIQGSITNNASVIFNQSANGTYSGAISGSGTVTKQGTSTITFSGTNTYTGDTTVSAGTLALSNGSALADSGAVTVAAGATLQLNASESIGSLAGVAGSSVNLNGNTLTTGGNDSNTTFAGNISGTGGSLVKVGTGQFDLTGTNSYTGGTTVSAGTLRGSSASLQGNILNNARLVFRQLDPAGGTYAGVISGTGTVDKEGANALIMTGNNLYTGLTTITLGSLIVNGQLTSDVAVNGGSLSGTGTILGAVNVTGGTTLSPGSPATSAGILTTGNTTFVAGANFAINIGGNTVGTGYDRLQVNGAVVLNNANLGVTGAAGFVAAVGAEFQIIRNDGNDVVVGTFAGLSEGSVVNVGNNRYQISYVGGDGNDVVLTAIDNAPAPKFSNGVLFIEGSNGADAFILTQTLYQGFNNLSVQVNGIVYGDFAGVTKIVIDAKGGDDRIAYTNEIRIATSIDGGGGIDTLDFTAIQSTITTYIGPGLRIPDSAALFTSIENIATGSGNDTFVIGSDPGQDGKLSGGRGTNTLDVSRSPEPVNVNLDVGKVDYRLSVDQIQRVFIPLFQYNTVNPTSASYSPATQKNFQLSSLAESEKELEQSFDSTPSTSHNPRTTSSSEKTLLQDLIRVPTTDGATDTTVTDDTSVDLNVASSDGSDVDAVFADENLLV